MPATYIKIFSRDFAYKDYAAVEKPQYAFDYLTLEPVQVMVPKIIECEEGDYVKVGQYAGIAKAVTFGKKTTIIALVPLLSLFNISCYYDRLQLYNVPIETFFADMIKQEFVNNADTVQNIPGLSVETLTDTLNCKLNLVDDVNNIYELAVKALTKYKMVINLELLPEQQKLKCTIEQNRMQTTYIKADLPNILEQRIDLQNEYGKCNKYTAVDRRGLEQNYTIYADDYAAPAFPKTEYIETGSVEEFKNKTQYKQLFLPERPRRPAKLFYTYAEFWIEGDTDPIFFIRCDNGVSGFGNKKLPYIAVDYLGTLMNYVWEPTTIVLTGVSLYFPAEGWYTNDTETVTPIAYDDFPDFIIDALLTVSTNIEYLGNMLSTKESDFYEKSAERAAEVFRQPDFNNLIELTVSENDGLVHDLVIGQRVAVIKGDIQYPTILTGYEMVNKTIKYIFGAVRIDLTKKLKIQSRNR